MESGGGGRMDPIVMQGFTHILKNLEANKTLETA